MLKIISGEKSGFEISSAENIRPILARIKKSVFDIITPKLNNALFLDLFAGSGAVGLESLSRGTKKVVFVEKDSRSVSFIYKNINKLGYNDRSYIIKADILKDLFWIDKVRKFFDKNGDVGFDIIFIGAPYVADVSNYKFKVKSFQYDTYNPKTKNKVLLNFSSPTLKLVYNSEILKKDGILILQHSIKEKVNFYNYKIWRTEKYGDTIVDFLKI